MSKYNEIAALAAKWSRAVFQNQQECQRLATAFVRGYADYLGCPTSNFEFRRLDGSLKITDDSIPFGGAIPFVLDGDGFWHFCLRIKFDGPDPRALANEQLKLSIKYQNNIVTIRDEQEFQVNPAVTDAFLSLYDRMFETSLAEFSSPLVRQSRRIGFV